MPSGLQHSLPGRGLRADAARQRSPDPVSLFEGQLAAMLSDLAGTAVEAITIDRCPRCAVFTSFASEQLRSAADLITVWAITKATERARADLYLSYAVNSARAGALERARDVALEAIGHVSLEDPRFHLLLGQIGLALGDPSLLREARAYLRFFKLVPWELKLYQDESSAHWTLQVPSECPITTVPPL